MKTDKNNKGFSLVELIIVIAIMAVLIGVLAPQYLKYVNNARVATDITNATEMAKFINAAIADVENGPVDGNITGAGGEAISNVPGLSQLPTSKVNKDFEWQVTSSSGLGVTQITLNGYEVYPEAQKPGGYYQQYYEE